ncbi:hypothetical protein [Nocardioides abyssi]|uniref:CYTH domain-containing protein n=1 Tax=Nocardioides abyssi TaxID=3058370 RepID=A0ABT8EXL4_9ACTN|nr:hypothetical protein [Nocardioides abyssi]MDN4162913.1 hypothetical protein [Nocardioides abyssi]
MSVSLKYAVVERERRYLLASLPEELAETPETAEAVEIVDRYVDGTRLRLREVRAADGTVTRKLTQKVRLGDDAAEVACTNLYLNDAEWSLLSALPGRGLSKTRYKVRRDGVVIVVDVHADGTTVAEIDGSDGPAVTVPAWLDVVRDVTADESFTGAGLAQPAG